MHNWDAGPPWWHLLSRGRRMAPGRRAPTPRPATLHGTTLDSLSIHCRATVTERVRRCGLFHR
jgi:hypothetical protein